MSKALSNSIDSVSIPATEEADALIEAVFDRAKILGIDAAEVRVGVDVGFSVNVRMRQLEAIEHCFEKSVTIKVYMGQRSGVSSTSELNQKALFNALEKASRIAQLTGQDACSGLPEKQFLAFGYPSLDLYHPWDLSVSEAIELALEAEAQGLSYHPLITNSEGADLASHAHHHIYANTSGFLGQYSTTLHSMSCSLLASKGNEMQRESDYTMARDFQGLVDLKTVANTAAKKAIDRLSPKSLSSRRASIIFSPQMAKGLIKNFMAAIRGASLYQNASFLLNHLGKSIFPSFIDIDQRPHLLKELGSAPFDADGVKTQPCFFVRAGVLENYLLGEYSSRRLKMPNNGNAGGPFNVFIRSGHDDLESLLKQMKEGLLVTDLIGHGVNLTNGDYSKGAFGFWVENGEIQYPVSGITIAGNLKDMFSNVVAVGNDIDMRGNIKTGSIWVDGMTIAGNAG